MSVNATSWNKLNITIPAGFEAVAPAASGNEIARAYLWNGTTNWTIILTAGSTPATKVAVEGLNDTGVSGGTIIFDIDYSPGGGVNVTSPWLGGSYAKLTLPTATANGSLNVSLPGSMKLTNITLNMSGQFMKNPTTAGNYTFDADGKPAYVDIIADAPNKLWINASNPAPGVDYADVEVEVRDQYGNLNATGNYSVTLIKNGSATVAAPNPNWTKLTGKCIFNVSDSTNELVLLKAMNSSLQTGENVVTFSGALHHFVVTLDNYTLYANNTDSATMTVQLKDENGQNLYASGTTINIAYANGTLLAVTPSSNQTDDNGQALFTVTAKGVAPATTTITMSESGGSSGESGTIIFKQASNAGNSVFTTPASVTAGTPGIITATLKDYNTVLIKSSGEFPVTFNMTSGDGYFTDSAGTANYGTLKTIDSTDANGNASVYVYSTNASTALNVNATVVNETDGDVQIGGTNTIDVVPNVSTKLDISPTKSKGLTNVKDTTQDFTLQLQDAYGNENTTADPSVLITTDNEVLGNMTFGGATAVNNNLWCNITDGNTTFTYTVNSTVVGTAHLTVNVTDCGFTDTITITTSGPTGVNLTVNQTLPLVGTGVKATAQLTGPSGDLGIANVEITFTLRDPSNVLIGTISDTTDPTGKVTYNFSETTHGIYTIKATNSSYALSATNTTTYVGNVTQMWIAVNNSSPDVNDTITVYAIFKDAAGYNSSSVDTGISDVTFLADDYSFATSDITNGVASATYTRSTVGTVTIDAIYTNATNPYWEGTVATNSTSVTFGVVPVLTTINVTPATPVLNVSDTQTFTETTLDQNGDAIAATVAWTSSNTTVGTINASTGVFTAVAAGTTTVTATSGSVTGTAAVTVSEAVDSADTNHDGIVDMTELFAAIDAYMAGTVDMTYLFSAIDAYMATA
ncbi:MAG: Bacterial Ig-like domain (group 2) [Candidatus Argoarchaeum ethanivorans]|uniref:Bacterial Ig-like domain (Group 2) n=1 Tax=Candidatus Argoarchaeum ethanivorans TaxID=2608793 RepID=A0A811T8V6_9EURY|nr:MAG: Bacterial Ig-like domain (group 2) [Candidatus Argoarchaeum ethanivorans]